MDFRTGHSRSAELLVQMVYNLAMFDLWAEQNHFGVFARFDCMTGWPVKKVAARDDFLLAIGVGHGDFPLDQVAPMRRLAEVIFETLEQRGDVCARTEGEVFSRHLGVTSSVAKVELLAGDCAGNVDFGWNVLFGDFHNFNRG